MAFDINGLSEIRALARNRYAHAYDTTDDLSTVLASGYFDGGWYRLGARDRLDIEASDGRIMAVVSAASAAGVTITASTDLIPANALGTGSVARSVEDELRDLTISVRRYGAKGDGVTDDTAAIQKAIDEADALYVSGVPWFPTLLFPYGKFRITAPLVWKRCHINGRGPFESYLLWDTATADQTVITRPASSTLRTRMCGLGMQPLNAAPAIWIDQSNNNTTDYGEWIEQVYFGPCTTAAIRLAGAVTNVHFTRLRWDACPFAIEFVDAYGTSSFRSIGLTDFTLDANSATINHQALIHCQLRGSTSLAVNIARGRIEGDDAALASNAAVVYLNEVAGQTMPTNPCVVSMEGVVIQWAGTPAASTYNVIHIDTSVSGKTTCVADGIIKACLFSGVDGYMGGTWSSFALAPSIPGTGRIGFHMIGGSTDFVAPYVTFLGTVKCDGALKLKESISAPSVDASYTQLYVPSTGDLTVKDGGNTIRTVQIDAAATTVNTTSGAALAALETNVNALITALKAEGRIA